MKHKGVTTVVVWIGRMKCRATTMVLVQNISNYFLSMYSSWSLYFKIKIPNLHGIYMLLPIFCFWIIGLLHRKEKNKITTLKNYSDHGDREFKSQGSIRIKTKPPCWLRNCRHRKSRSLFFFFFENSYSWKLIWGPPYKRHR